MPLLDPVAAGLEAPPSNLGAVIRQIREVFDAAADAIPVMVGARYLKDRTGRAPRILFVPGRGTWGPPIELGNAASVTHACEVYVRGGEDGDDIDRWERAYAIADRVLSALDRKSVV